LFSFQLTSRASRRNVDTICLDRFRNLARRPRELPLTARLTPLYASELVAVFDWRCAAPGPSPFGPEEWNGAHELVVPRRGAFVRSARGAEALLDPGTIGFAPADESYRVRHPVPGGDACTVFRLRPASADALLPARAVARTHAPLDGPGYLLHRLTYEAARSPDREPLRTDERAAAFLAHAVGRLSGEARPTWRVTRASMAAALRAREIVALRYRERLPLAELAREAGASPWHLTRTARAVFGAPLHRIVVRLRLREALERVLDGERLSSVAYAVGFASHSHMTDAFRREYGCAPSAVRRLGARGVRAILGRGSRRDAPGG
jgi:AraC family transcriptional regulator